MNKYFKKAFASTLVVLSFVLVAFSAFEPVSVGAASSATDTVVVTLTVTDGISITDTGNTTMSTPLGVAQDVAVGTTTFNVKTNAALGYTLALRATSTPAMRNTTNTIADYQTGTPNTWNATTGNAYFGYSVLGTGVATSTWGTGTTCSGTNGNATSTTLKYKGFTTSDFTVLTRNSTTTTAGLDTLICYAVEQRNFYIPSGSYNATIVATATTL